MVGRLTKKKEEGGEKMLEKGKGIRIKARDTKKIFSFYSNLIGFGFIFLFILIHLLLPIDFQKNDFWKISEHVTSPVFITVTFFSLLISSITALMHYKYFKRSFNKMKHCQTIARLVINNGWCDFEAEEDFIMKLFRKEKPVNFPRIWYKVKESEIKITVAIDAGRYDKELIEIEERLEINLYSELMGKLFMDGYMEYTLFCDLLTSRIGIEDVVVKKGKMKLMENLYWTFDKLPHMLLVGGTGGGKSYYILTIIEALLKYGANLHILDPKNSDLADLATVLPNVHSEPEKIKNAIEKFYEDMMARSKEMKEHKNYKTGKNYAYLGLEPNFLIFDEYVAFMDMMGREAYAVMDKIKKIVMLGRQSGFFIILACQRADAKYMADGIRDQFNFRVALGRNSEIGYGMIFGDTNKKFIQKDILGRGYVDTGTNVIREKYTPLVPEDYDFLQKIGEVAKERGLISQMEMDKILEEEELEED